MFPLQGFPGAVFKFADGEGKPLQPEDVSPPFRLSFSELPPKVLFCSEYAIGYQIG